MDKETHKQVAAAVDFVARSKAPLVEFAPGTFGEAVGKAVAAGYLSYVGNGVVHLAEEWKHLSNQKDPEGIVLNNLGAKEMVEALGLPRNIPVLDVSEPQCEPIVGSKGYGTA